MQGPFWFLLLYQYFNVWFVKCDMPSVMLIFTLLLDSSVHSLSPCHFSHRPSHAPCPSRSSFDVPQPRDTCVQSAWSMEHIFLICIYPLFNQASHVDNNNAVFTLLLNINPLAIQNVTIRLCFLHQQVCIFLASCPKSCQQLMLIISQLARQLINVLSQSKRNSPLQPDNTSDGVDLNQHLVCATVSSKSK